MNYPDPPPYVFTAPRVLENENDVARFRSTRAELQQAVARLSAQCLLPALLAWFGAKPVPVRSIFTLSGGLFRVDAQLRDPEGGEYDVAFVPPLHAPRGAAVAPQLVPEQHHPFRLHLLSQHWVRLNTALPPTIDEPFLTLLGKGFLGRTIAAGDLDGLHRVWAGEAAYGAWRSARAANNLAQETPEAPAGRRGRL